MNEQEQRIDAVLDDALAKMRAPDSNPAKVLLDAMYAAYAAGVKTAPPPPGHIIDDAGNVRKVLGTLPLTADGMVAGVGCELWADFNAVGMNAPLQCLGPCMPCVPMARLYGSREAAEAARKEGQP